MLVMREKGFIKVVFRRLSRGLYTAFFSRFTTCKVKSMIFTLGLIGLLLFNSFVFQYGHVYLSSKVSESSVKPVRLYSSDVANASYSIGDSVPQIIGQSYGTPFLTRFEGIFPSSLVHNWEEIAVGCTNISLMSPTANDPRYPPSYLARRGIGVTAVLFPWDSTHTPLDTALNTTYRAESDAKLLNDLNFSFIDDIDGIILGDEDPVSTGYKWFYFDYNWPDYILRWNNTFYAETGLYFRDANVYNDTERAILVNWVANKSTWAMNHYYTLLKNHNPNWKVIWNILPSIWLNIEELLSDHYGASSYTTNLRMIFADIRAMKTMYPDKSGGTILWGDAYDGVYRLTKRRIQEQFWVSYFAGADMISWFAHGWMYNDPVEEEVWSWIKEVNQIGMRLTPIDVSPPVLEIEGLRGFAPSQGIGFTSWDCITQRAAVTLNLNLSKYSLIVVRNQYLLSEDFVTLLNEYVANGGYLLLLGNTGNLKYNEWYKTRQNLLSIEKYQTNYSYHTDANYVTIDDSQLKLSGTWKVSGDYYALEWTPSGDFTPVLTNLTSENQGKYPIVLYHNTSNPNSGTVLYCGISDEDFQEDLIRAFAQNIASVYEAIAPEGWEDTIISAGIDARNMTHIGFFVPSDYDGITTYWLPEGKYFPNGTPSINVFRTSTAPWTFVSSVAPESNYFKVGDWFQPNELVHIVAIAGSDPVPQVTVAAELGVRITNVPFTLQLNISNLRAGTVLEGLTVNINLPSGINLESGSSTWVRGSSLSSEETQVLMFCLRATDSGHYTVPITISGSNFNDFTIYVPLDIRPGRLDLKILKPEQWILPGETIVFNATIVCSGQAPTETLYCEWIIRDYHWDNPGSVFDLSTIKSGEIKVHNWSYTPPDYVKPYDDATFRVFAYSGDDYWSEVEVYVHVVAGKLIIQIQSPNICWPGEDILLSVNVTNKGWLLAKNTQLSIDLPDGLELKNESENLFIGTLDANNSLISTWILHTLSPGIYTVKVVATADGFQTLQQLVFVHVINVPQCFVVVNTTSVNLTVLFENPPSSVLWFYRLSNETIWSNRTLTQVSTGVFQGYLGGLPAGSILLYYLQWNNISWPDVPLSIQLLPEQAVSPTTNNTEPEQPTQWEIILIASIVGIIAVAIVIAYLLLRKKRR